MFSVCTGGAIGGRACSVGVVILDRDARHRGLSTALRELNFVNDCTRSTTSTCVSLRRDAGCIPGVGVFRGHVGDADR